jgi:radical SAM-linked protein
MPVAYSQGFNPHPRLTIAMPLPVGCTGEREVIDILLDEPLPPEEMMASLEPVLPRGISVVEVDEVLLKDPALPSLISKARYEITLAGLPRAEVEERVAELMDRDTFQVVFRRKTFDLRALIGSLVTRPADAQDGGTVTLEATLLRNSKGRIGRPDVLLEALGLSAYARRVHRTHIVFAASRTQIGQGGA